MLLCVSRRVTPGNEVGLLLEGEEEQVESVTAGGEYGSAGVGELADTGGAPGGKVLWAECGGSGPTWADACAA